jgi:hypothetical protein
MRKQGTSDAPVRRVVLLGASNLTRGISTAIETAWLSWGQPLEILVAAGLGRSYGMTSSVLGRELPGIVQCGLWSALRSSPRALTTALVTDIGNDVVYGVSVDQIVAWINTCLDRLERVGTDVVLTGLPIGSLAALTGPRYLVLRSIFFPFSRLPLDRAIDLARELDGRVRRVAEERKMPMVRPLATWYGVDPIHIKMRHWASAWSTMLCPQHDPAPHDMAHGSLMRWMYLMSLRPERRRFLCFERTRRQPAGRMRDGTTVAFY